MSKPGLKLDWCSAKAARWACEHWHYSKCTPKFKTVKIGVWESKQFIGCVVFGNGAAPQLACPFGLERMEVAELCRVALREHQMPVTRIVSIALRLVKRRCPGLRVIVSYADPEQGHHGGIYQAGNWFYLGETTPIEWFVWTKTGERVHTKTVRTGRRGYATHLKKTGQIKAIHLTKYKYAWPFDTEMRAKLQTMAKPYPKRVRSIESDATATPGGKGSCDATRTL